MKSNPFAQQSLRPNLCAIHVGQARTYSRNARLAQMSNGSLASWVVERAGEVETFEKKMCVHGHHVYKAIWEQWSEKNEYKLREEQC